MKLKIFISIVIIAAIAGFMGKILVKQTNAYDVCYNYIGVPECIYAQVIYPDEQAYGGLNCEVYYQAIQSMQTILGERNLSIDGDPRNLGDKIYNGIKSYFPDWLIAECNPSPTPTVTPTPTAEPTPTVTVEPSASPTPTLTVEVTPTPTPTITVVPSDSPTPTPTVEVTPSVTPTPTVEVTPTVTPTPSIEVTPSVAPTPTEEVTPSVTPEVTPTETPEVTPTPSVTPDVSTAIVESITAVSGSGGNPPTFAGSTTNAPTCGSTDTTLLPANPFVLRNGTDATVDFFLTQGDSANIYWSVAGQPLWGNSSAQTNPDGVKPNGDNFVSYVIHALDASQKYVFGIQQKYGCGGGQIIEPSILPNL